MRRFLAFALKAAISAILLYFAVAGVDLAVVGERLRELRPEWMIAALALAFIQLALGAARWRVIARECRASLELPSALRLSLIAAFFNQVLPSSVGGDAVRVWLLARKGASWSQATYSVLLDRFVGVLMLAALVVACLPWSLRLIGDPIGRTALLAIGFGSIAGALLFLALGSLRSEWLRRWAPIRHLMQMALTARSLLFSPRTCASVMALSIAIHTLTAGIAWCAAHAVDASFGFFQALQLVPPVMLISIVPVSVAGWGVREKSLVLAFGYAGLAPHDGFLISVLLGATYLAVGVAGGIAWLAGAERSGIDAVAAGRLPASARGGAAERTP
jgi:uncharacterized membrane protein YbhN (UPF0104 family)